MFLDEFSQRLGLCPDAAACLKETYLRIKDTDAFVRQTNAIENGVDFMRLDEDCTPTAEALGIHRYTYWMALLCGNFPLMQKRYRDAGYDDALIWETAIDFRCKIEECKRVFGLWGIFPFDWYQRFFEARLFKLGRLEFEQLSDGSIKLHIPSCGPMPHEALLDSYRNAYVFFGGKDGALLPFLCSTYLLYPPYRKTVFSEGSNIDRFASDFTIIRVDEKPEFYDCWRVFDRFYSPELSSFPQNTSLQKRFIAYMKQNDHHGTGLGLFLFDGQSVHNERTETFERIAAQYQNP